MLSRHILPVLSRRGQRLFLRYTKRLVIVLAVIFQQMRSWNATGAGHSMQPLSAGNESNDHHGLGAVSIDREGFVAVAMAEGNFSAPCCRAESHQGRFDYPVTRMGFG